ncbi:hypothetical protein Leryth_019742 [Lithospermum erythrorhizon]|nr:hypothetical protein Leryth_019742 [Lithospermum erythrorhizon]
MDGGDQLSEIPIEIRRLSGESISVSILPNKTIQDLKFLLTKTSFKSVSSSSSFHLYFKGGKLDLQRKISECSVGPGDFIVFVPMSKKDHQQMQKTDGPMSPSLADSDKSALKLAESSYSSLMKYLSTPREVTDKSNQSNNESENTKFDEGKVPKGRTNDKPSVGENGYSDNKYEGYPTEVLSLLQSACKPDFDEQACKIVSRVVGSVNCLRYPSSGNCIVNEASWQKNECTSLDSSCSCPVWLKDILKTFTFLNIYHSFLQVQGKNISLEVLGRVLTKLSEFGFHADIPDIVQLPVLCPKVVQIIGRETDASEGCSAITIFKECTKQDNECEANKWPLVPKVVTAMKKREVSFRIALSRAVLFYLCKNGTEIGKVFSLEGLLNFAEETCETGSNKARKRISAEGSSTSDSDLVERECRDTTPFQPMEMLEHLKKGFGSQGQVVHVEDISARVATYVDIPSELSGKTMAALVNLGIYRLYSHQAEAIQASLARKNVIVATLTSSGKSLCYNVPVLEVLLSDSSACALYLFPTKALAQDQLRAFLSLTNGIIDSSSIGVYDGDTSEENRIWLRDNARVLITNPDMLHVSILPFHKRFSRILSNLRFIVIDEAHTYKGAFGCHTSLIFRRLNRLCSHVYGSEPSFIFCTATSANPGEHAKELANLSTIELIKNDGSPSTRKLFVLWNPPLFEEGETGAKRFKSGMGTLLSNQKSHRSSPIMEISYLFAEMVQHGLRCIAFCKSRKLCELVLFYTRGILTKAVPEMANSVCSYRGGYTAQDRRRIESELFSGKITGIAATNALELGIDVGHIDVTLHLGFPGTIASLWQQAGRSGRREKPSLAIYVAFDGPLDQYFMQFPEKLFRASVECCHVDSRNPQVVEQQLVCAAMEHPLSLIHDEKHFGPCLESAIMKLKSKGCLSTEMSCDFWNYIGHEKMPCRSVSIRAIDQERYKVIDMQKDEVIEEIEESQAFFQVYEGAVYMNQGKTYLVKELDLSSKLAFCQEASLKYYTKTRDFTDVHVTGGQIAYPTRISSLQCQQTTSQLNRCIVTTRWIGFYRISKVDKKLIDTVEMSLPDYSYESEAVWVRVPQSVKESVVKKYGSVKEDVEKNGFVKEDVENKNKTWLQGLHAARHALLNVVPLYVICSSCDLASECINPNEVRHVPERLLLYDARPGGTGISAQVQPRFSELLTAAVELLTTCKCKEDVGCPHCIQNKSCMEYNEVLHKDAAITILKGVLDAENSCLNKSSDAP